MKAWIALTTTFGLIAAGSAQATVKPLLFMANGGDGLLHIETKEGAPNPKLDWWQFHGNGQGVFSLSPAKLTPFVVHVNNCWGGFDAQTKVTNRDPNALFVIGGMQLKAGAVETAFAGPEQSLSPTTKPLEVKFKSGTFTLSATGAWKPAKAPNTDKSLTGYKVILKSGQRSQELFVQDDYQSREASLLWAGDLDRDGRLDLVMNLSYWNGGVGVSLFLSSYAAAGGKVPATKGASKAPPFVVLVASDNPEDC